MEEPPQNPELQTLLAKSAIAECLHRYTRGIDRLQEDLILSAFHEDAAIRQGGAARSPRDFVASYLSKPRSATAQHHLTNVVIELDGDSAHAESYFMAVNGFPDATVRVSGGRYIDRLERRDGSWRIAARYTIPHWTAQGDASEAVRFTLAATLPPRDRSDLSYQRPLARPE